MVLTGSKQIVADDQTQENKDKSDDLISDQDIPSREQQNSPKPKHVSFFPTGAYIISNICSSRF